MKKYKVRITKMPSNDVMAYGGQTGYGLDLGQRKIYADMRKSPTDSASSSMTEKDNLGPDEEYRIVAENNETIVGDFDQSGELGFQTIKGDYHSAPSGGTYLTNKQAVDGAYIFPQTKSMYIKDKNFLEQLGIKFKKGGISPADASKKFDMMAEKKVLDDPYADKLSKNTASMVKANKEQKLQMLADYVESMKGNPQGNPDIFKSLSTAQYGGYMLPEARVGYNLPAEYTFKPPTDEYIGGKTQAGRTTPMLTSNKFNKSQEFYDNWEQFIPGFKKLDNREAQRQSYQWMLQNNPDAVNQMWHSYGLTNQGKKYNDLVKITSKDPVTGKYNYKFDPLKRLTNEEMKSLERAYVDGMFGVRQMDPGKKPQQTVPNDPVQKYMCTPQGVVAISPNSPANMAGGYMGNIYDSYEAAQAACQRKTTTTDGGGDGGTGGGGNDGGGGSSSFTNTPTDPYLPYNGIQMAQTLDAFSRPVKGYFDRPFVPEYSGMNAMYDDPNYNPLLSANATKQEFMNQFGNAQAARASGTYNPDLMQGLIGETQRARANNLNIFNTTEGQNNQMYNQNSLNRANVMKQTRDNNIRTREQMDIAEQLKFQNAMNAFGKMSGDRIEMQKYNEMYPQFAVTGRLWDQMSFVKGKPIGQQNSGGGAATFESWLASQPDAVKNVMKSGSQTDQLKVVNMFEQFQRQRQNTMYKNPQYVQANRFIRDPDED